MRIMKNDNNYNYLSAGEVTIKKCAYCGKEFEHIHGHIEYKNKRGNKTFCSYTCQQRYGRENPEKPIYLY